uniref:AAA-ATPase At2g46620-like n=1 Tax=Erigeron canadensis TaxID=72917 RepID=UPI001CB9AE5D|nr:AAA-ATPase At2g46620-like [Erigeron canadensis]
MFFIILLSFLTIIVGFWLIPRVLSRTSIGHFLQNQWRFVEECFHSHQFYKIPKFNQHMQENPLFNKIVTYLNSLPSAGDSDYVNLFSGNNYNPNEITLVIDHNQVFLDSFLGSRIFWKLDNNCFVLKLRRKEKRRILTSYFQHIHKIADEIDQTKEVNLYINAENDVAKNGRWVSTRFKHPATIDTAMIDIDLKNKVKSDLESFLKSRQYYHRLGRVWKRSYLLYGPSGTGKSSFIAGMSKFLCYDIYDIDLSKVVNDSDLKMLLLQTKIKSMIVVEDLDRYLIDKSTVVSLSGILNFMDGIISGCGEERVMVFTVSNKDLVDPAVLRPGRIDVHIHFPLCDFSSFKNLASSHLGIKEHKLFPQVEEIFQTGASLSPAEIGEIMISNRGSPTRALKTVINALQTNSENRTSGKSGVVSHKATHDGLPRVPRTRNLSHSGSVDGLVDLPTKLSHSGSTRTVEDESTDSGLFCMDNFHTGKELKNLYGLLKNRSRRRESVDLDGIEGKLST